jgi:hypothetical protein
MLQKKAVEDLKEKVDDNRFETTHLHPEKYDITEEKSDLKINTSTIL